MRKRDLDKLRNILLKRREGLIQGATETRDQMHSRRIIDEPEGDEVDVATDEIDQNLNLRIRDREGMLLNKVEKALKQIEDGTYGVCAACGEDIATKRLMARPVATLCINCKQEQEKKERAFRE
ncbi:MAG: TraR/DksA C4-type zinc finger protein [Candidatus Alcyoniella australis]|nr:TraR/DksA C4-type zinc finger protein [Candidatus Alcyoniella australis]